MERCSSSTKVFAEVVLSTGHAGWALCGCPHFSLTPDFFRPRLTDFGILRRASTCRSTRFNDVFLRRTCSTGHEADGLQIEGENEQHGGEPSYLEAVPSDLLKDDRS